MTGARGFRGLVVIAALAALAFASVVWATPVASNDAAYVAAGRVFPDPHGCLAGAPGTSPWAKGRVCAADFLQWQEVVAGLTYLEERFGRYAELVNLRTDAVEMTGLSADELQSAGLPREDLSRLRSDLYVLKVTDSKSPIPEPERHHFAYSLSIHGIERAGIEGGVRAAEDLVTWAACEAGDVAPACADDGPFPKRILEPTDSGPTAGDVLRRSVVYFVLANPDGWRRGDKTEAGVFYQRYNGNGADLNRDWPSLGFVERMYTPWSEPESRAFGRYLSAVRERTAAGRFDASIDLHGMGSAHAFSFTMIGSGEHDYGTNAAIVDTAVETFRDAEARLTWSSLIAPSESCPGPVAVPLFVFPPAPIPMCADQWGTVWDTIDYTTTGSFGDWMNSEIGLGAIGISNEMAFSHIVPNTVFDPEIEQLHIDGNKGLIYAQIATTLDRSPAVFDPGGRIAYIDDPARLVSRAGASLVAARALPAQATLGGSWPEAGLEPFEFDVLGPADGVANGALSVEVTFANVRGVSAGGTGFLSLEYCGAPDHPGDVDGECREVASYYNQSGSYLQAGARIDLPEPRPGPYRVVASELTGPATVQVDFSPQPSLEGAQQPYDVSRLDFFDDLRPFLPAGDDIVAISVGEVLRDPAMLDQYDTVIAADAFMPGADVTGVVARAGGVASPGFETELFVAEPTSDGWLIGTHEFDVDPRADNEQMIVDIAWSGLSLDFDVLLDRFDQSSDAWIERGCSCEVAPGGDRLEVSRPGPGRWRVRVRTRLSTPQSVDVVVSFVPPVPAAGRDGAADVLAYASAMDRFVQGGGNLVLTDGALQGLPLLVGGLRDEDIGEGVFYAGWIDFDDGEGATYDRHPLAAGVDKEGAAEGTGSLDGFSFRHRHQTYEPTPLGFYVSASGAGNSLCTFDRCDAPSWVVDEGAWRAAGGTVAGRTAAIGTSDDGSTVAGVSLGSIDLGEGVIQIAGSLLPQPTQANLHPYGLASHALTYTGYQVFENLTTYSNPTRPAPEPSSGGAGGGTAPGVPGDEHAEVRSGVAAPSAGRSPSGRLAVTGGVGLAALALAASALGVVIRRQVSRSR